MNLAWECKPVKKNILLIYMNFTFCDLNFNFMQTTLLLEIYNLFRDLFWNSWILNSLTKKGDIIGGT